MMEIDHLVSGRLYHDSMADIITTRAVCRAENGSSVDAEDISRIVAEYFSRSKFCVSIYDVKAGVKFVHTAWDALFVMYFKAALLPSEREWNKKRKMWTIRGDGDVKLERLCRAFAIPIQRMGKYDEEDDSYFPNEAQP